MVDSYRCSAELMLMVIEGIRFVFSGGDLCRVYGSHRESSDTEWCWFFEDVFLDVCVGDVGAVGRLIHHDQ
jgi:hypothetical protein